MTLGPRGHRRWKTADLSHSARAAHGAPPLVYPTTPHALPAHAPCTALLAMRTQEQRCTGIQRGTLRPKPTPSIGAMPLGRGAKPPERQRPPNQKTVRRLLGPRRLEVQEVIELHHPVQDLVEGLPHQRNVHVLPGEDGAHALHVLARLDGVLDLRQGCI